MNNDDFKVLDDLFRKDDFPSIEAHKYGVRFLKLRSMSRRTTFEAFFDWLKIPYANIGARDYFAYLFSSKDVTNDAIDKFINQEYQKERQERLANQDYLVDQLNRLKYFDWGGSFGNSLEKNIVNNYVKKIQSYDRINEEIETSLLSSMRGYTLNSWYNHWTSILIEDLFKDHSSVLPTVGLVKKIDFFINDTPFDLKVTYFPEQLISEKLRALGYGNELTKLKQICRRLDIMIPTDLKDKELKSHLYSRVKEDQSAEAKEFIEEIKSIKKSIIREAENDPAELKKWFYENQGEARFDASNRFFLVLTDENEMEDSWKLKRNIKFLQDKIHSHLESLSMNMDSLETEFYWSLTRQTYKCKSDILFLKYS
jgi:hypothetical protein